MCISLKLEDVQHLFIMNDVGNINIPNYILFDTINDYIKYLEEQEFTDCGITLLHKDGIRSKIRNEKFSQIRSLGGNLPRIPIETNQKNLFYNFWRLRKENKINEFF